jgi:hypothetical protein
MMPAGDSARYRGVRRGRAPTHELISVWHRRPTIFVFIRVNLWLTNYFRNKFMPSRSIMAWQM